MHAYLITGNDTKKRDEQIEILAKGLNAKILEFPLVKIEDVRSLNDLIRLTFSEPTLIVSKNIDEAGEEALNAFLKNLEEPGQNLFFALTAASSRKVLSTIVSRCQIIRLPQGGNSSEDGDVTEFINKKTGEKLAFIDKLKDRAIAVKLVEDLIFYSHKKNDFSNMELFLTTLKNLKANGNINLQLTNMVIHLV